jgi:hypothetical protein
MLPFTSLLLLLLAALPAAAQPSCTAPPGPLQATICADPELRAADRRVRALEAIHASLTPRPATTEHRARAWQREVETGREGRALTREELLEEYGVRREALDEVIRQDRAMRALMNRSAQGMPRGVLARPADIERRCLGQVLSGCRVVATGLALSEDGRTRILWQQQQGHTEANGVSGGMVLLAEVRGGWRLLGWSFEGHTWQAPRVLDGPRPLLVHASGRGGGSGSTNADLVYRLGAEGWEEIEHESWKAALPARLPAGLGVWQAVDYDLDEPGARGLLWRDDDANCCPTGGSALFSLAVEGRSLRLREVQLDELARRLLPTPDGSCPAERADYALNAPGEFTLRFEGGWPGTGADSDLALVWRSGASGRTLWFTLTQAQGPGGMTALPVAAPGPRAREDGLLREDIAPEVVERLGFYAFRQDMTRLDAPPRAGQPAPRFLFLAGLPGLLREGELGVSPGGEENMPLAVFRLSACRAP